MRRKWKGVTAPEWHCQRPSCSAACANASWCLPSHLKRWRQENQDTTWWLLKRDWREIWQSGRDVAVDLQKLQDHCFVEHKGKEFHLLFLKTMACWRQESTCYWSLLICTVMLIQSWDWVGEEEEVVDCKAESKSVHQYDYCCHLDSVIPLSLERQGQQDKEMHTLVCLNFLGKAVSLGKSQVSEFTDLCRQVAHLIWIIRL
jgi:hypothetical protein